jgi:shikimate kinase
VAIVLADAMLEKFGGDSLARCAATTTATSRRSGRAGGRCARPMPRTGRVKRHLVLVGLPGSGKSTVGRIVAEHLGAAFIDIDAVLIRRMQMPISRIFGEFGEQRFRELEREAHEATLAGRAVGGLARRRVGGAGGRARVGAAALLRRILKTLVTTAATRVAEGEMRPLLDGENPLERMRTPVHEREPFYRRADAEVRNDPPRTAEQAADEVLKLARTAAGW